MKRIERLVEIGLTRREAAAYVALLGLEEAKAGEIARFLHQDRTNVYDSLSGLVKKGLAGYVRKGRATHYRAAPPDRLKDYLSEKQRSLEEVLPELARVYGAYPKKASVQVYEGNEGIKTVLSCALKEGKEILGFGATDRVMHLLPDFTRRYLRQRERLGIRSRQFYTEGQKVLPTRLTFYKAVPREYSGPAATFVCGDKVAIMLWFAEPPLAVVIDSHEAALAYKNKFEFMWKIVG